MAQKVGIRVFSKLYPACYFKGWVRALEWDVRACWPALLCIVKKEGWAGEIGEQDFREYCDVCGVPWEAMSAFLAEGIIHGAISIHDQVITVLNWKNYQTDPTGAERQKAYKSRHSPPHTPPEEALRETETETVTLVTLGNAGNALPPLPGGVDEDSIGGMGPPPRASVPNIPIDAIQFVRKVHRDWCEANNFPINWKGTWDSDVSEHYRINGDALIRRLTPAIIHLVDLRAVKEGKPWFSCPKSWLAEAEQQARPKRATNTGPRAKQSPEELLAESKRRRDAAQKHAAMTAEGE